jgi:hypothetical protein
MRGGRTSFFEIKGGNRFFGSLEKPREYEIIPEAHA